VRGKRRVPWRQDGTSSFRRAHPGGLRDTILSLARANGIPADHVDAFDASRQHNRVSANVSEEWLLCDHPSGRSRSRIAMRWKAEQRRRAEEEPR
jgi:hypothetical protein